MTTCAWMSGVVGADTMGEQSCMRIYNSKIYQNDRMLLMGAGLRHQIARHWSKIANMSFSDVLELGYPEYQQEDEVPSMILVGKANPLQAWNLTGSVWSRITRPYHAIGSGRDFAMATMRLGLSVKEAIEIASEFDIYTGGEIEVIDLAVKR